MILRTIRDVFNLPPSVDVCPHCKQALFCQVVHCDGYSFVESYQCPQHGNVPPMRSAVVNPTPKKVVFQ